MSGDSLHDLAQDLGLLGPEVNKRVKKAVTKSSQNVRKRAAQFSSGIAHAPRYPRSITYSVTAERTGWVGEIGPENTARNQGFLGRTLELGNATTPPQAHLVPAMDREGPTFEAALFEATNVPL